ncbi:MAG: exosortase system-associated protein, TIGR04073 family [Nitrosomonas sp.]|nr:exosortase system-associated protein, TIGR04073 family [Nitrosomonas sp.]
MKLINYIFLLLVFLAFSAQVNADDQITTEVYFDRAGLKLGSGVVNVFTGWMELPKNIGMWRQKNESEWVGVTEGVLRGLIHTASRTASGAVDVITFWLPTFPTPSPLFVWDDYSVESEYQAFRTGG